MNKTLRVALFDAKPYDRVWFEKALKDPVFSEPPFAALSFEIDYYEVKLSSATAALAKNHNAVCAFVNDRIDREVAAQLEAQGITLVALRSAGYNNVDLEAVWGKIHVLRVPAYSPHAVAEHAAALLQTLNRKVHLAYNRVRDGNFALSGLVGRDLHGQTAGIVGTGKIGKILATILRGYGMKILLNDPYPDDAFAQSIGAVYTDRDSLYRNADVISLHCPLTPDNRYMIDEKSIALMKREAIVINTGRGALIDTRALVEALKAGRIRGAALDVYEEEEQYFFEDWSLAPIRDDLLARLIQLPNVILTAHQAFLTEEALSQIARTTLLNIASWAVGERLENEICYHCADLGKEKECVRESRGSCWNADTASVKDEAAVETEAVEGDAPGGKLPVCERPFSPESTRLDGPDDPCWDGK